MTKLHKALAEVKRVTQQSSPWEAGDIGVGGSPVDYHIATILNAVASGALVLAGDGMSDAPELLPCPFCGSVAEIVEIGDGENASGSCGCCTGCMASGNVEFGFKENFVSNWNRRADLAAAKDARIAELERQLAEAREVKPLEWADVDAICTRKKATALGGHYSIVEFDANTEKAHFAVNIDLGGLAFVFILEPDPLGGRRPKRFPTIEAAKSAAQADYADRILSALKETP